MCVKQKVHLNPAGCLLPSTVLFPFFSYGFRIYVPVCIFHHSDI